MIMNYTYIYIMAAVLGNIFIIDTTVIGIYLKIFAAIIVDNYIIPNLTSLQL